MNDGKAFEENPAAQSLLEEGIKVVTGGHPLELLDEDFAVMVKNPGIPYTNPMVERALEKGIPVLTKLNWPTWFQKRPSSESLVQTENNQPLPWLEKY